MSTKGFYHDAERLRANRNPRRGIRTMLIELLEHLASHDVPVTTVGNVNAQWRTVPQWS